ncbi:hypothetical protein KY285_003248 [Solanum tuberosum]|nr:hypothetical protein KY284_003415 [Solanum tuberosum]KAH0732316.1 hypothetical protein KY289_003504 [Solanum tuberosum]KAH0767377.1 hypothetical protein KY285_003248 [Solanum tuberosum]
MFGNRKEKVELLEALVVSGKDKDATVKTPNYSQRIYILCGDDDKIFNKTFCDDMKKNISNI